MSSDTIAGTPPGIITRSTKAKLEELEAEEEQIKLNILKEQTSTPKLTKEQILFALGKFRKLDLTIEANKERLIDSLVKCIILYDDKLVITFNFKNEPVTVPTSEEFDEIEKSSDIKAFASPEKGKQDKCPAFSFLCLVRHRTPWVLPLAQSYSYPFRYVTIHNAVCSLGKIPPEAVCETLLRRFRVVSLARRGEFTFKTSTAIYPRDFPFFYTFRTSPHYARAIIFLPPGAELNAFK